MDNIKKSLTEDDIAIIKSIYKHTLTHDIDWKIEPDNSFFTGTYKSYQITLFNRNQEDTDNIFYRNYIIVDNDLGECVLNIYISRIDINSDQNLLLVFNTLEDLRNIVRSSCFANIVEKSVQKNLAKEQAVKDFD